MTKVTTSWERVNDMVRERTWQHYLLEHKFCEIQKVTEMKLNLNMFSYFFLNISKIIIFH